jgi:hypothetical protein
MKISQNDSLRKDTAGRAGWFENCLPLAINFSTAGRCCLSTQADRKRQGLIKFSERRDAGMARSDRNSGSTHA